MHRPISTSLPPLAAIATAIALNACAPPPPAWDPVLDYKPAFSAAEEAANLEIPTVQALTDGNILVTFENKGCSVLFDHDGKLLQGGRLCDDVDLHRAREAAKAHIAERESDFLDV